MKTKPNNDGGVGPLPEKERKCTSQFVKGKRKNLPGKNKWL